MGIGSAKARDQTGDGTCEYPVKTGVGILHADDGARQIQITGAAGKKTHHAGAGFARADKIGRGAVLRRDINVTRRADEIAQFKAGGAGQKLPAGLDSVAEMFMRAFRPRAGGSVQKRLNFKKRNRIAVKARVFAEKGDNLQRI